jgi:putative ABC transport system substrate-binding protein
VQFASAKSGFCTFPGRFPAINIFPDFARKGGLMAYGPELQSLFMQAGAMTRKVL